MIVLDALILNNLNSIMILLIPLGKGHYYYLMNLFKFHYDSINSFIK